MIGVGFALLPFYNGWPVALLDVLCDRWEKGVSHVETTQVPRQDVKRFAQGCLPTTDRWHCHASSCWSAGRNGRQISVQAIRREQPDLKMLAQAFIEVAKAELAKEQVKQKR